MSEEFEQTDTNKKETKKESNLTAMLFSGVAGGLIVALFSGAIFLSVLNEEEETAAPAETETTSKVEEETPPEEESVPATNLSNDDSSLSASIEQVSDAVVGVSNIQQVSLWEETDAEGTGSGVIYKQDDQYAYVVTNNHVVEGAQEVEVILTNGDHVDAQVLGTDALSDLAVLRISNEQVEKVATLGSSDNLSVGQTAIAIGNPLGTEFAGSVTKGIISGLDRSVDVDINGDRQPDWTTEVIQTDAAINPGNSGGALINTNGEVIGINSMKIAQAAVEGIGFAIPIDDAKPIIEELETDGEVKRPFIGISAVDLSTVPARHKQETLQLDESIEHGLVVARVEPNSPADKAGLQQYDVVTSINDQEVEGMLDLKSYLYRQTEIGEEITITYYREGEQQTTSLTLSEQDNI